MPNVNQYGLFQLLDLRELNPNDPANAVDSGLLVSAINMDAARHNADINALLRLFAFDTTDYSLEVDQTGSSRNQPLDENGRAIPIKPPAPYTVQLPLQGSGAAYGANYVTRIRMTVRDLARTLATMFRGDYQWVQDHVLGHLFQNANYTHRDPTGKGDLTIRGLANGDTTTYYNANTNGLATDSHYIAQAAAIADATNPYPIIKAELMEHPANLGEVIAFIPSNLVTTTQALLEFRSAALDPDIRPGANTAVLTGSLGITLPVGASVKGKTDSGVWIVEWPALPNDYIIAIASAGPRPLGRRQFEEEILQGFRSAGERADFPYFESQWQRWEGYGGYNRVGAVVYRVNNGAYAVPTNFAVPMA